ncbi:MAG: hypothetical protein ACYTG0_24260 [Planctomycetota bacterium]
MRYRLLHGGGRSHPPDDLALDHVKSDQLVLDRRREVTAAA